MENNQGLELAGAGLGLPQAGLAGVVGEPAWAGPGRALPAGALAYTPEGPGPTF